MSEASERRLHPAAIGCGGLYLVLLGLGAAFLAATSSNFAAYRDEALRVRELRREDAMARDQALATCFARAGRERILVEAAQEIAAGREPKTSYAGVMGAPYADSLGYYETLSFRRTGKEGVAFEVQGRLVLRDWNEGTRELGLSKLRVKARFEGSRLVVIEEALSEGAAPRGH